MISWLWDFQTEELRSIKIILERCSPLMQKIVDAHPKMKNGFEKVQGLLDQNLALIKSISESFDLSVLKQMENP